MISTPSSRPLFDARCRACWFVAALLALIVSSFWSVNLEWGAFFSTAAATSMANFVREFFPPDLSQAFLAKVWKGLIETFSMSLLGTVFAAIFGLMLALPASMQAADAPRPNSSSQTSHFPLAYFTYVTHVTRTVARAMLNVMRSIPELVWASLLLISAGLGPFAGTLALALHTTGVLGRLFAEAIENAPPGPAAALRTQGVSNTRIFFYATLPQIIPQITSYTLYRWENNIRAAAVLGVVGAGGLGQLLSFHMGLFQMNKTATILSAMILLVALVDLVSYILRRILAR
jgi:phosphonate transport system permease protein